MKTKIFIMYVMAIMLSNEVKAQSGYIRKDTLYIQGTIFKQSVYKNNRQLIFTEKEQPVTYSPDQVQEYGFINGDSYYKRTVPGDQKAYFLLRLVSGERKLYELKEKKGRRFFIEHDSSFVEIKKGIPLRDQLAGQLMPCSSSQRIAAQAHFGRNSLKRAVSFSNSCFTGLFPRLRKGVFVGYESGSQSLGSINNHVSLTASNSSPLVGVFVDVPLSISPSWLMSVEATYQQCNFGGFNVDNAFTYDYQYNFSTIGFPLLLKYRGSSSSFRPFIGSGLTPAIYNQKENTLLETTTKGSTVNITPGTWDNVKTFQVSGTLCAGLEYSITQRKAISLELRYKKLISGQVGPSQSFALITSFYF